MSRGKSVGSKRGNRTLACYMDTRILDRLDQDSERDDTPSPARKNSFDSQSSQNSNGRSQQQENEERKKTRAPNAFVPKANNNRPPQQQQHPPPARQRSNTNFAASAAGQSPPGGGQQPPQVAKAEQQGPPPIAGSGLLTGTKEPSVLISQQQQVLHAIQQQQQQQQQQQNHLLALQAGNPAVVKDREDYWYYDQSTDGFYYEHNGSRGWRKRNPKLHGSAPLSIAMPPAAAMLSNRAGEEGTSPGTQTIEKKVYVPVPVPVFTAPGQGGKFFPQAGTSPNIKYYDPSSDGFFFEAASVDGWRRRQPASSQGAPAHAEHSRAPRPDVGAHAFAPGRDLTNQELEDLILAKVGRAAPHNPMVPPFAPRNPGRNAMLPTLNAPQVQRHNETVMAAPPAPPAEYPSSSSTVSSSISDDVTPPPPSVTGKENHAGGIGGYVAFNNNNNGSQHHHHQQQRYPQTKEPAVGSFDEPYYEFYWSEEERSENNMGGGGGAEKHKNATTAANVEQASSVSSVDEGGAFNPLSIYLNDLDLNGTANAADQHQLRIKRPNSLKISNPPPASGPASAVNNSRRLPRFNVDQFIATLPGNDNFMGAGLGGLYAPLDVSDSPRTPFNAFSFNKESPMYTPLVPLPPAKDSWGAGRFTFGARSEDLYPQNHLKPTTDKAAADIERGLRDIEKFWQSG